MTCPDTYISREKGFTLLELLLVVGVSGLLLLGVAQITRSWIDSEIATGSGQHLQHVSAVVKRYIEARWAGPNALPPTADALSAAATPTSPWAGLLTDLQDEGLLTTGNALVSPLGTPLQIAYVIDNSSGQPVYRATIFATTALPMERVLLTARQAGNVGGTISSWPNGARARGAFGQWDLPKTQLLPGGTDPCTASNTPANPLSCLVAIVAVSQNAIAGPYLYRDDLDGAGTFNTMNTALFMNGRDVVGAGTINTNNLDVQNQANLGNTVVDGTSTFRNAVTVEGGMTVQNGMTISGDANFSGNVQMNGGNLNATNLNADVVQSPTIRANNLDVQDMTVQNGDLTVDNNINVNGDMAVSGAGSEVLASTINAGTINGNSGNLTVGQVNIQNTMTIDNGGGLVITSPTRTLVVDRLVADDCVKIDDGTGTNTYLTYGTACP